MYGRLSQPDGSPTQYRNQYSNQYVSLPVISPYSSMNYQNYQPQPEYGSYKNQGQNYNNFRQEQNHQNYEMENKSFVDAFDNNSSTLQKKSHARNIQGRLFSNNVDRELEAVKIQKTNQYREELQAQMEEIKRRKQAEKDKIQKEEMERERKFYQEFKIKAQVKDDKGNSKGENVGFMARTLHKIKKVKAQNTEQASPKLLKQNKIASPQLKGKGKNYLNESSLDNHHYTKKLKSLPVNQIEDSEMPEESLKYSRKVSTLQESMIRQKFYEEERISKLLLYQQKVLQKLSDIKTQIRNTSFDVDAEKQLLKIRNSLRARPIPFQNQFNSGKQRRNGYDSNIFYSLPKRQIQIPQSRYAVKLRDISMSSLTQSPKKQSIQSTQNDKNFKPQNIEQNQQENNQSAQVEQQDSKA